MPQGYSHIVIGSGTVGSAAAYWLSQRGAEKVLVLEQFDLLHPFGSFGDHSRIIRRVYPSADYVRLTDAMFDTWHQIELESGLPLITTTGGLDLAEEGTRGAEYIAKARLAMDEVGTPYDSLSAEELQRRFPQWNVSDRTFGIFQPDAGVLDIRRTVSAHTSLAQTAGVEFRGNCAVTGIELRSDSVVVKSTAGEFHADNLVVTAGSWMGDLMKDLGLSFTLTLSQEQVSYFSSHRLSEFTPDKHPVWIYHGAEDTYYGFPVYGEAATKLGRDMRSRFIASDERVFVGDNVEGDLLADFLQQHLPASAGPALLHRTCVYDMTPDRGFVLDRLPEHPHVAVFNGAGHAAKFGSIMGQILADLATVGSTPHSISAMSLSRPAVSDPNYPVTFTLESDTSPEDLTIR